MNRLFTDKNATILVTGCDGWIGDAVLQQLKAEGYQHIKTDSQLDLRNQSIVHDFFEREKPEYVWLALHRNIGSGLYQHKKADFIHDQLMSQTNVMHAAHVTGVKKCLFVGSPYVYPASMMHPLKESDMLAGKMDTFQESFGLIDILGVKMGQACHFQYETNYVSVIPPRLYGPGMPMEASNSALVPYLIHQIRQAKKQNKEVLTLPVSGNVVNEYVYITDFVNACFFLMAHDKGAEIVNIGSGCTASTTCLAGCIAEVIGYEGSIQFEVPAGKEEPGIILDASRLAHLGWKARTSIQEGIRKMLANDSIF